MPHRTPLLFAVAFLVKCGVAIDSSFVQEPWSANSSLARAQTTCSLSNNYDCWGDDLPSGSSPVSDPAACCTLCSQTTGCAAFTHDQYSATGAHVPTCFLKSACTDRRSKSGAVSGSPSGPAPGGYVNNYDGENPLKITPDKTRSNNYFLILGDWGKSGGPSSGDCMDGVANMIKAYVQKQKAAGKTLLFIAVVGDNFYWSGVDPSSSWDKQWSRPYGTNDPSSPLYLVPWLAVHGNHDLGNTDPYAFCPDVAPKAHINGQAYAGQQLNADRNPTRPPNTGHYWLPDFNYHYHIPDVDLELIAIDRNANDVSGLGGDSTGHTDAFNKCGGQQKVQDWLQQVDQAGTDLLVERAQKGTASSTVIIQHYPGLCGRDTFEAALNGRQTKVLCAYGHTHNQNCDTRDSDGVCIDVLTGGGGGCCSPEVNLAGFTAVTLDDKGGFSVDVESSDVRMHNGQCRW